MLERLLLTVLSKVWIAMDWSQLEIEKIQLRHAPPEVRQLYITKLEKEHAAGREFLDAMRLRYPEVFEKGRQ